MPELPEVETIVRQLAQHIIGKKINGIWTSEYKLRFSDYPKLLHTALGQSISTAERIGKYIIIGLGNQYSILFHLGMSGRLRLQPPSLPHKHEHVILTLDEQNLVFYDPRRFGLVDVAKSQAISQHKRLCHIGPDPFDQSFNQAYLLSKLGNKRSSIKAALLDASIVAGIGNIYASESLFVAKILPTRPSLTITSAEADRLIAALEAVLTQAIKANGSTLKDYAAPDGSLGSFQSCFQVYDRQHLQCHMCENHIAKVIIGQRSTFYCPTCQT